MNFKFALQQFQNHLEIKQSLIGRHLNHPSPCGEDELNDD